MEVLQGETRVVSTWVFVVSCVLALLGLIPSVLFLIFNIRYKRVRLIKMSSPNLNVVISLGGFIAYMSLILWGLEAFSENWDSLATTACRCRTWIVLLSFTLIFGALLVKSWRVRKIFESAPATKVIIKDKKLFCLLGVFLCLDLVILLIWQLTDPLQSTWVTHSKVSHAKEVIDVSSDSATFRTCSSHYSSIWWSALYIYKTFILLYSAYLSWAIRAVTIPSMNDSVAIILSCLVTTFTGSATAAICMAFSHLSNVTSTVTMASIWLCTTFTLCVVYIPKISMWWKKSDEEMMKIHVTPQVISSPNQSIDQVEGEILHLVAENRTLRKSLSEKEHTIKELQTTVTRAKDKLNELLLKEDSRHDSGLDLDLSSSDLHINEHDRIHASQIVPNNDTRGDKHGNDNAGQCHLTRSSKKETERSFSKWSLFKMRRHYFKSSPDRRKRQIGETKHRSSPRRDYFPKSSEYSGYPDYSPYLSSRIRDSISDIAHHMDLMDSLTNQLHSSITMDMIRYRHVTSTSGGREPPLPYGDYCYASYQASSTTPQQACVYYAGSRVPYLAGSIVDSYNLERDSDTMSYVSNHLSNNARSKNIPNDIIPNGDVMVTSQDPAVTPNSSDVMSSRDNLLPREQIYTLENDMYYPTTVTTTTPTTMDFNSPLRQHKQTHRSGKKTKKQQGNRAKYKKHQKHKPHPNAAFSPNLQHPINVSFV